MKMRNSTKIGISFVILIGALYFGWAAYSNWRLSGYELKDIEPKRVNLVAIKPGSGYRIIVANQVAQLVEGTVGDFSAATDSAEGKTEGADKKRVPIREMLKTLQGDEVAFGEMLMILNNFKQDNLPPVRVDWEVEDIKKALSDEHPELEKKLTHDLNVTLDGKPLDRLDLKAMQNGIVIKVPVPLEIILSNGQKKTLIGKVLRPYQPKLMRVVQERYAEKKAVTTEMIKGYYIEEARKILDKKVAAEDVRNSILYEFDAERIETYAAPAKRLLSSAKVLLNEDMIIKASYETVSGNTKQKIHTMHIQLTETGQMQLWKYSKGRKGFQLLFTVDGVAIAAPMISSELMDRSIDITRMPDEVLVRDAVDLINKLKKAS